MLQTNPISDIYADIIEYYLNRRFHAVWRCKRLSKVELKKELMICYDNLLWAAYDNKLDWCIKETLYFDILKEVWFSKEYSPNVFQKIIKEVDKDFKRSIEFSL